VRHHPGQRWEGRRRQAGRFGAPLVALLALVGLLVPLADAQNPIDRVSLQPTLDNIAAAAPHWGVELAGISYVDLRTGDTAALNGDAQMSFMSSSKFPWMVMATAHSGIAAVRPLAHPVFASSDNVAAGTAIDLAGGLNHVNNYWYPALGMTNSCHQRWGYGRYREYAGNCGYPSGAPFSARGHTFFNHNSPIDMTTFLSRFWRGEIPDLDAAERAALLEWSTWSFDEFNPWGDGTITGYLPPQTWPGVHHKIGWYFHPFLSASDIGIVNLPSATYALAIAAYGGHSTGHQADFLAWASCEIYRQASGDLDWSCGARKHTNRGGIGLNVAWSASPDGPFAPLEAGPAATLLAEATDRAYLEIDVFAVWAAAGNVEVTAPGGCGRTVRALVGGQRYRYRCEVPLAEAVRGPWYVTADSGGAGVASGVYDATFHRHDLVGMWQVEDPVAGSWIDAGGVELPAGSAGRWKLTVTNRGTISGRATATLAGRGLGDVRCGESGGATIAMTVPAGESREVVCTASVEAIIFVDAAREVLTVTEAPGVLTGSLGGDLDLAAVLPDGSPGAARQVVLEPLGATLLPPPAAAVARPVPATSPTTGTTTAPTTGAPAAIG
jgi:hypothetical protein